MVDTPTDMGLDKDMEATTTAKYEVVTIGRNHYVTHGISREFVGVAFTSKAKAQAKADEKNAR